ncbi:MAG TPA: hypothetical protein VKT29_08340 [Terriglobales bacterium]|nr:hypothetical protein [Terriglobales bacterium]
MNKTLAGERARRDAAHAARGAGAALCRNRQKYAPAVAFFDAYVRHPKSPESVLEDLRS